MYLTRCQINPAARGARKLLGSPQAMHAAILAAFHDGSGEVGRVLWRVDVGQRQAWLYMTSAAQPDLSHLIDQAGWPTTQTWDTKPYKSFLDHIDTGQQWAFRLRGNPVRSIRDNGQDRGRKVGHVTVAHQMQWLVSRADALGIDLGKTKEPTFTLTNRGTARFQRRSDGTGRQVTISWAQFDGTLVVVEPDRIRTALVNGVGSAKGYGCGLLTLARTK